MKKIKFFTSMMCTATILPIVASLASCKSNDLNIAEPSSKESVAYKTKYAHYSLDLGKEYKGDDIKLSIQGDDSKNLFICDGHILNNNILSFAVGLHESLDESTTYTFDLKITINGKEQIIKGYKFNYVTLGGVKTNDSGLAEWDGDTSVSKISFPSNVTEIKDKGFKGCKNAKAYSFPEDCELTTIGTSAFENTVGKEFILPKKVSTIGANAFTNSSIETFTIEDAQNNQTIGANAFANCKNLKNFVISGTKSTTLNKNNFAGCSNLSNFQINNIANTNDIPVGTFSGCTSLNSISLPGKYKVVGSNNTSDTGVFQDDTNLQTVSLGNSVTTIGANTFKGCSSLTNFTLPTTTTTIQANAFEGCESLKSIDLSKVTSIGAGAFAGAGFETLGIYKSNNKIPDGAFAGCKSLTTLTLNNIGTSGYDTQLITGTGAFKDCINLKGEYNATKQQYEIVVNKISAWGGAAQSCFEGCTSIENISFTQIMCIPNRMFAGCTSLNKVSIPAFVGAAAGYIQGQSCFEGSGITELTLGAKNLFTKEKVFWNCPRLKVIDVTNYEPSRLLDSFHSTTFGGENFSKTGKFKITSSMSGLINQIKNRFNTVNWSTTGSEDDGWVFETV